MERKVAIRPYCADDEPDLFSLAWSLFGERLGWHDRWTLEVLETDLVFVAEVQGSTAGYAAVERSGDAVRIEQMLVSPVHDEEHIESRLVEYAEGYAISLGARSLQVVVESDNAQALDFYHGRGFVSLGGDLLELILPSL